MLFKSVVRSGILAAIGCIVMAALSIAIAGCGRNSEEREMPVQIVHDDSRRAPAPVPMDAPAAAARSEEGIAAPEPEREVSYEEAEAAYLERRYGDAAGMFVRYTRCNERNPWGYYMLGLSAWKAGDGETAQAAFEQALGLDPNHVKSWLNLSRVLLEINQPEEALAKIDAALAIDPESNDGLRLQGRALHQLGRNEEAIAAYRRAIHNDGEDAWSMNNLALILIEQERFEAALPPLARAIEIRDDIAVFYNNLGMALERTGHTRAAEGAYASAVAVDGLYEHAAMNLERVEAVMGDPAAEPVDLAALARRFVEEVEMSKQPVVASEQAAVMRESVPAANAPVDSVHTP